MTWLDDGNVDMWIRGDNYPSVEGYVARDGASATQVIADSAAGRHPGLGLVTETFGPREIRGVG